MRCARHILLFLVMLLALPEAIRAQSVCEQFDDELTASELDHWSLQLRLASSVGDAPLARSVVLVNDPQTDEVAPFVPPVEGPPRIHIPRGFRRLQCGIMQFQMHFIFDGLRRDLSPLPVVEGCVDDGESLMTCMIRLIDGLNARAGARRQAELPYDSEERATILRMADDAFFDLLLHEFAHILLRHETGDDGIEAEADSYAAVANILNGGSPSGSVTTLATMSMVDSLLPARGGDHGTFGCRALKSFDVGMALFQPTNLALMWVDGTPYQTFRERRSSPPASQLDRFYFAGDVRGCPRGAGAATEAIRADLERFVARLGELYLAEGLEAELAAIDSLMALPFATDRAKGLRLSLVALRLIDIEGRHVDDSSQVRVLAAMAGFLQRPDLRLMHAPAYAKLLTNAAILAYNLSPPGQTLDAMNRFLRQRLLDAESYQPALYNLQMQLGVLDFLEGDCENGRRRFATLGGLAPNARRAAQGVASLLAQEAELGCAGFRARIRANLSAAKGWRDGGTP